MKITLGATLAELWHQWYLNHDERCSNEWPHDGHCYYPLPPVLVQAQSEELWKSKSISPR